MDINSEKNNIEQKRKKRRFNAVDFAVLFVVISIAIGMLYKLGVAEKVVSVTSNNQLEVTVLVKDINNNAANFIKEDDSVSDHQSSIYLGKVTEVKTEPATDLIRKSDGSLVYVEIPGKSDVYITFRAEAKLMDEGYYINGVRHLAPNSKILIGTDQFLGDGFVYSVNKIA